MQWKQLAFRGALVLAVLSACNNQLPPISASPTPPASPKPPASPAPPAPTPPAAPPSPATPPIPPTSVSNVYLNHYCLLSDHTNLCSRVAMYSGNPSFSLKVEPKNSTGKTLTGTLVVEYDAAKINPGWDGNIHHSVNDYVLPLEKSAGRLVVRNFKLQSGQDYFYLWSGINKGATGDVFGKTTFSWKEGSNTQYVIGCYKFKIGSAGGGDNMQGDEKNRFNGYGGLNCGTPTIVN
jgi:hypothetical protein